MYIHALLNVFNGTLLAFKEKYCCCFVLDLFLFLLFGGPRTSVIKLHLALLFSLADTESTFGSGLHHIKYLLL